jgi:hypothetical protein
MTEESSEEIGPVGDIRPTHGCRLCVCASVDKNRITQNSVRDAF